MLETNERKKEETTEQRIKRCMHIAYIRRSLPLKCGRVRFVHAHNEFRCISTIIIMCNGFDEFLLSFRCLHLPIGKNSAVAQFTSTLNVWAQTNIENGNKIDGNLFKAVRIRTLVFRAIITVSRKLHSHKTISHD